MNPVFDEFLRPVVPVLVLAAVFVPVARSYGKSWPGNNRTVHQLRSISRLQVLDSEIQTGVSDN